MNEEWRFLLRKSKLIDLTGYYAQLTTNCAAIANQLHNLVDQYVSIGAINHKFEFG